MQLEASLAPLETEEPRFSGCKPLVSKGTVWPDAIMPSVKFSGGQDYGVGVIFRGPAWPLRLCERSCALAGDVLNKFVSL